MGRNNRGFTIIEVVLFLALSGLLFLVGFIGVGVRTRNVQATDSMRSLESFVQQKFNEIVSGVNSIDGAGVDNTRIVMGYMFHADGSVLTVYTIVGDRLSGDQLLIDSGETEIDLIESAEPTTLTDPGTGLQITEVYDVRWNSRFVGGYNNGLGGYEVFGFIRSPGSTEIYPIALDLSGITSPNIMEASGIAVGDAVEMQMCYELPNSQVAALQIAPGSQNESIRVLFEGNTC